MKPGTLAELIAWLPPPQLEIIKHGILPQGAVMIIYGMAGVYKTFLVMDMAASISVAKPWLIYPTVKANTLVLNTEMPKIESRKRWMDYAKIHTDISLTDGSIIQDTDLDFKLNTNISASELRGVIKAYDIDNCIVDNFYSAFQGDISSNPQLNALIENCKRISWDLGTAFTFVHHTHQPRTDYRGNIVSLGYDDMFGGTFLRNWADTIMSVTDKDDVLTILPLKHRRSEFKPLGGRYRFNKMRFELEITMNGA